MTISVQSPDILDASIDMYPVTAINDSMTEYTYVYDENFDGAIPSYDAERILGTSYMKAIVLEVYIKTSDTISSVDVRINFDEEWLGTTASMEPDPDDKDGYLNFLSNVVQFKSVSNVTNNVCTTGSTTYSFISGSLSNPTKSEINLSIPVQDDGENHLFLVMEYNETLIRHFCNLSVNVAYSNDIDFTVNTGANL